MAINLDEIIAGSSSVDDVVKALTESQKSNQNTAAQLSKLAEAAKGSFNPMFWLKQNVSPASTAGTLSNEGGYKRHVIEAQENGEAPMTREEYNRMRQKMQDSEKGNTNSKGMARG